ncbi:hypothetical protein N9H37_01645 [Congregibacter sp.]|nr:hypothetical protein [Congregibacter sp.]MDA8962039.1 hypothetical protein [Congregibacter sp.]
MIKGLRTLCSRRGAIGVVMSAMLAALSACGGGGGGSDGGGFLPGGDSDTTSYTITLTTVDAAGNPTTLVTETFPATLRVEVKEDNSNATPVSGLVVLATAEFAAISPANGQALTNDDGIAELEVRAGATFGADTITVTAESPAGTVTATIGVEISGAGLSLGYFEGTAFVAGQIGLSSDSLAFRGTAVARLAVVDEAGTPSSAVQLIRLSSACSLSGLASFRAIGDTGTGTNTLTIETLDGLANAEYLAGSCESGDDLTATLIDGDSTATASVTIAGRDANFIGYVSTQPTEGGDTAGRTIIALKGTGGPGRPEVASVTFEVLEEAVTLEAGDPAPGEPGYLDLAKRKPLAGVAVNFSLTNTLGGITLLNASGVTNSQGLVVVEVSAGNVATSTVATASFDTSTNQQQAASSNQIVISTGLAQQNGISVSASQFHVPGARDIDGVESTITVRLVDRFGNPVADGTSVVFTTEYGAIDTSCLTGVSNGTRADAATPGLGTCSVLWTSQAPRFPVFNQDLIQTTVEDNSYNCPSHTGSFGPCPDDLGAIRGLRSTVTITVVGEEFFVDGNGNGLYDEGEPFENLPEAFTDYNEDGVYTPFAGPACPAPSSEENCIAAGSSEEFIDFNGDGMYSENVDPNTGEGVYNGTLCPPAGDGVFCSRDLLNVRANIVLTLSASAQNLQVLAGKGPDRPRVATNNLSEGSLYDIYIADVYNNAPGAGTTLTFRADEDCQIKFPEDTDSLEVVVPDLIRARGAFTQTIRINGTGATGGGRISILAADPSGATSQIGSFGCVSVCNEPTDPNNPNGACGETP